MRQIDLIRSPKLPKGRHLFRVVTLGDLAHEWVSGVNFLVRCHTANEIETLKRLRQSGLQGLSALVSAPTLLLADDSLPCVIADSDLSPGGVLALIDGALTAQVLFRSSDNHHTVFLTNRCDNYCLMCSQPPHDRDDAWLIDEAMMLSRYIPVGPEVIGFSGGEPLLLGIRLREVLDTYLREHTNTLFEVLTNGRRLVNRAFAQSLLTGLGERVSWMVPLYGHADFRHDFVVQKHGAFDETISGILCLQEFHQAIQLRVVLIAPVLDDIEEICRFVSVNLPFVQSMAFMGCEPVGFALANRPMCDINLNDHFPSLAQAIRTIERVGINPVIMNVPLCCLPRELQRYAVKSISNWKQAYGQECLQCSSKDDCGGYFVWQPSQWERVQIKPIRNQNG